MAEACQSLCGLLSSQQRSDGQELVCDQIQCRATIAERMVVWNFSQLPGLSRLCGLEGGLGQGIGLAGSLTHLCRCQPLLEPRKPFVRLVSSAGVTGTSPHAVRSSTYSMLIQELPGQNVCYKPHSPATRNQRSSWSPQAKEMSLPIRIKPPVILCTSFESIRSEHRAHSTSSQCPQLKNEETGREIPEQTQQEMRDSG